MERFGIFMFDLRGMGTNLGAYRPENKSINSNDSIPKYN